MNVDDGRLMRLAAGQEPPDGFEPVPDQIKEEAEEVLSKAEAKGIPAVVDFTKKTPLTHWAKHERKKKAKSKMARASRKANRRKS
jgi:hypothetical protein